MKNLKDKKSIIEQVKNNPKVEVVLDLISQLKTKGRLANDVRTHYMTSDDKEKALMYTLLKNMDENRQVFASFHNLST